MPSEHSSGPIEDPLESREFSEDPVIGYGVTTLPYPTEDESVMFDLPAGMASLLASETGANIQSTNHMGRTLQQQLGSAMGAVVTRIPTEPSVIGGRTVSGIMATPIASPTVQVPGT